MSFTKQLHQLKSFDDRHKWLIDADFTYCAGRYLLISDNFFFASPRGYLLHQAAEKYLKALRKALRPQIEIRKHKHDLNNILKDIKTKITEICFSKLTQVIEPIELLGNFRYVDSGKTRDPNAIVEGIKAVDNLVVCVRKEIENTLEEGILIINRGIKNYIRDENVDLLIKSLLHNNSFAEYWKGHLSGLNARIDRKLSSYQN